MGHEIVGTLPRTERWRSIIADLESQGDTSDKVQRAARETLSNVTKRYDSLNNDQGVSASFRFLLALTHADDIEDQEHSDSYPKIDISEDPNVLELISKLKTWVNTRTQSTEYADLATKAASDSIIDWTEKRQEQPELFGKHARASQVWTQAASGAGFCEVSRLFFSKLTERYLKYFLDRELSASLSDIEDRDDFDASLSTYLDRISQYAFETSKIAESFSAGWYNKHAADSLPPPDEVEGFLGYALGKMRDEIVRREGE